MNQVKSSPRFRKNFFITKVWILANSKFISLSNCYAFDQLISNLILSEVEAEVNFLLGVGVLVTSKYSAHPIKSGSFDPRYSPARG